MKNNKLCTTCWKVTFTKSNYHHCKWSLFRKIVYSITAPMKFEVGRTLPIRWENFVPFLKFITSWIYILHQHEEPCWGCMQRRWRNLLVDVIDVQSRWWLECTWFRVLRRWIFYSSKGFSSLGHLIKYTYIVRSFYARRSKVNEPGAKIETSTGTITVKKAKTAFIDIDSKFVLGILGRNIEIFMVGQRKYVCISIT